MTEIPPADAVYLESMLDAIARVRRYVGRKRRAGFLADAMLQDAVIRNIEVLGEAAARISREFAGRDATIPWRDIAGMRHRLIHGYLKVNLHTVWQVVDRDLALLERQLRELLPEIPSRSRKRRPKARART
ncbi:MAG TPA: DUF86 domain-containing protein [Burkholderiales bacterium]|nr:DUF86 domain-containing protein [Burkholderiales bacterium]